MSSANQPARDLRHRRSLNGPFSRWQSPSCSSWAIGSGSDPPEHLEITFGLPWGPFTTTRTACVTFRAPDRPKMVPPSSNLAEVDHAEGSAGDPEVIGVSPAVPSASCREGRSTRRKRGRPRKRQRLRRSRGRARRSPFTNSSLDFEDFPVTARPPPSERKLLISNIHRLRIRQDQQFFTPAPSPSGIAANTSPPSCLHAWNALFQQVWTATGA